MTEVHLPEKDLLIDRTSLEGLEGYYADAPGLLSGK